MTKNAKKCSEPPAAGVTLPRPPKPLNPSPPRSEVDNTILKIFEPHTQDFDPHLYDLFVEGLKGLWEEIPRKPQQPQHRTLRSPEPRSAIPRDRYDAEVVNRLGKGPNVLRYDESCFVGYKKGDAAKEREAKD